MNQSASVPWDHLESLSADELALLTDASVSVLEAEASPGTMSLRQLRQLPASALSQTLADTVREAGVSFDQVSLERAVREPGGPLSLMLLQGIATSPGLRKEVEEAYAARRSMMSLDPATTIAASALLLLVLKLRKIEGSKKGWSIDFYQVKETVLGSLASFFASIKG